MLGRYENFPEYVHNVASFNYQESTKDVQHAVLAALHQMNNKNYDITELNPYVKQDCTVGFEFGVADGFDFCFIDQNTLENCLRTVNEKDQKNLDFFFVVRYHNQKGVPLRFDYHVLRFVFKRTSLETRIRHEKGTQRVPLEELTDFIIKQINSELVCNQLSPLVLRELDKMESD
ncbi:MAG: hypothetical protein WC325_05770 [Candidatus Bathyarchaeia archaeon]